VRAAGRLLTQDLATARGLAQARSHRLCGNPEQSAGSEFGHFVNDLAPAKLLRPISMTKFRSSRSAERACRRAFFRNQKSISGKERGCEGQACERPAKAL